VTTTVATTADHVVTTTVAHAAMTEVQEVHVVSVRLKLQSRTTSQRCSNLLTYRKKEADFQVSLLSYMAQW
jgi:hypothetical protein